MKGQLLLDTVRGMMNSQFDDDLDRLRSVVQLNQRTKIGNDICDKVSGVSICKLFKTYKPFHKMIRRDNTKLIDLREDVKSVHNKLESIRFSDSFVQVKLSLKPTQTHYRLI